MISNATLISDRGDPDAQVLSLFGLAALFAEMQAQGVAPRELLTGTGILPGQLNDPQALISKRQRLTLYENADHRARDDGIGMLAGARQRVSDFGIYGYALASSRTLGEALELGFRHLRHAGPVLEMSFRVEGSTGVLRSHDPESLGELLPFVAEFWRSSFFTLISRVLEAPFPCVRMLFPYAAPPYWRRYASMFDCPVEFNAGVMEWHIDERSRSLPLPNANPMTALMCQNFCEQMQLNQRGGSDLALLIRTALVDCPGRLANVTEVADQLGVSERTLHRRLAQEELSFQAIVDGVRRGLAIEYLERTGLSIEQIAARVGFSDASNFRKAFKRWTGHSPSDLRGGSNAAAKGAGPG
jgi:AraC-like DNA-binding protein